MVGVTKGKGFQGGVKRHGWSGGDATHGSMFHRAPGSIGASSDPSRVWPGHPLPGRMGGDRRTVLNLPVVRVLAEQNLILLRGAVPGARGRLRDGAEEREADQGAAAEGAGGEVAMPSVPVLDASGKSQRHPRARRRRVRRRP